MLKYAEEYQNIYLSRLFLTAGSLAKLTDSLEQLLDVLALPERDEPGHTVKFAAFRDWLATREQWLLLIDNVGEEEGDMILDMLPSLPNGHVILTSQRHGVMEKITGRLQLCLEIREPSMADSVEMFLESCEIVRSLDNIDLAQTIVKDVGYLPHAVRQCASYIRENGIDLHEYIFRYQKAPEQVKSAAASIQHTLTFHRFSIGRTAPRPETSPYRNTLCSFSMILNGFNTKLQSYYVSSPISNQKRFRYSTTGAEMTFICRMGRVQMSQDS